MKKLISIILSVIMLFCFCSCSAESDSPSNTTDDELVRRAIEINNLHYDIYGWLYQYGTYDSEPENIIYISKYAYTDSNGKPQYDNQRFILTTKYTNIEDYLDFASQYLSKSFMETMVYGDLCLSEYDNYNRFYPALIESGKELYLFGNANGVSMLRVFPIVGGRVLERTDNYALIELDIDPDAQGLIDMLDGDTTIEMNLVYEDGAWKEDPYYGK